MNNKHTRPTGRLPRAAAVLIISTLAACHHAWSAPPTMGVHRSHGDDAQIARYETFTGQRMAPIVDFSAGEATNEGWVQLSGSQAFQGLDWNIRQWDPTNRSRIVWTIPMLPKADLGATLAKGANGDYDHHWRAVADTLIRNGCASNTVRIGWEFNGYWYQWNVGGTGANGVPNTTNYQNYWKRIVLAMRSVPGGAFKFNWCGALGEQRIPQGSGVIINPAACYPEPDAQGDYVDEIGVDVYDTTFAQANYWNPVTQVTESNVFVHPVLSTWTDHKKTWAFNTAWTAIKEWGNYDLDWWATFAASKGKPLTIPEWGLAQTTSNRGGGDSPIFMQKFHEWLINPTNNVKWHAYFQENTSWPSQFFEGNPGMFPLATEKFLDLFTGRPVYIVFQNPVKNVAWTGGYGTRTLTELGTDGAHVPFEGNRQYRITYTTSAGVQIAFPEQNLAGASHLSLAVKGPLTNASQALSVRLFASDGTSGPLVALPRTTDHTVFDVALSALAPGLNLAKVNSLYLYATTAPAGTSDTVYLDSILFTKKN